MTLPDAMPKSVPDSAPSLLQLHAEIDRRVGAIRQSHPDWLCGKGCDRCCRQLAELPQLTAAEWALLSTGLALLSPQHRSEINQRVAALAANPARPVVCPLLDQQSGECPVYAFRPVACRTYGFYVQRALGLYCREIEVLEAGGELAGVVWGNHDAVDQRLDELSGPAARRSLAEWLAEAENAPKVARP